MDNEKAFDDFFGIHTTEKVQELTEDMVSRMQETGESVYQATYYNDLVKIFNEVTLEPEDTLVDFGCGLGRVLFYGNSRHYCNTVGIENNPELFAELMKNVEAYQSRFLEQEERMLFLNFDARAYQIRPEDNFFYFFNPFSREIFREVLKNIVISVKKNPRDINILLYYPSLAYQREIRDCKLFVLKKMIKLSGYEQDPDEKVLVYHLSKYFVS